MPTIISIVYTPDHVDRRPADHYARVSLERVSLIEGVGIEGDTKGGGGRSRQLNIMSAEILAKLKEEGFDTDPGEMGEQIIVSGVNVAAMHTGDRLRLGKDAVVEVVVQRTGCDRFEHIQKLPKGSVKGRLGVMARIVASGTIQVGDVVE
jgi:MOSC domain-containing protein YiiM